MNAILKERVSVSTSQNAELGSIPDGAAEERIDPARLTSVTVLELSTIDLP